MYDDIIIREIKMPLSTKGFVIPDDSGIYNIYINIDLSTETKRKAIVHELAHIKHNDFGNEADAAVFDDRYNK